MSSFPLCLSLSLWIYEFSFFLRDYSVSQGRFILYLLFCIVLHHPLVFLWFFWAILLFSLYQWHEHNLLLLPLIVSFFFGSSLLSYCVALYFLSRFPGKWKTQMNTRTRSSTTALRAMKSPLSDDKVTSFSASFSHSCYSYNFYQVLFLIFFFHEIFSGDFNEN